MGKSRIKRFTPNVDYTKLGKDKGQKELKDYEQRRTTKKTKELNRG